MARLVVLILFVLISSCSKAALEDANEFAMYDSRGRMSTEDYYDVLKSKKTNSSRLQDQVIERPNLAKMVSLPKKPMPSHDKLITITTSEDVEIKEILLEIGRISDVDIQVSPDVRDVIILSVKNKPLYDVLDGICETSNLRYEEKNGVLIFENDDPYVKSYDVNFLNMTRSAGSSQNVSNNVTSSTDATSANSGSTFTLSTKTDDTFWQDMTAGIRQIINETTQDVERRKSRMESIVSRSASAAVLSGNSANTDSTKKTEEKEVEVQNVAVNRHSGVVTVYSSKKGHEKIQRYITNLIRKTSAQVLIEVKVVEVTLTKNFSAGIDWTLVNASGLISSVATAPFLPSFAAGVTPFSYTGVLKNIGDTGLSATVNMLKTFGTTKTLISPRLNAVNNQPAVLTVATNKVYFNVDVKNTLPTATATSNVIGQQTFTATTTVKTIPEGITITLQPSINIEKREITMNVRPSITKISSSTKEDPGFNYMVAGLPSGRDISGLKNIYPEVSVKELDTIVKVKDGDVMIMGGFTERKNEISEKGVPVLSSIPILGNLFKTKANNDSLTETVVLIKSTIVDDTNVVDSDREFYDTVARKQDPRRVNF